jgi:hypothetical protein
LLWKKITAFGFIISIGSYVWILMIKIYITIILPFVFYGCETLSLILREECRLRVFENRVLRIFGTRGEEVAEAGENCIMRSIITCMLHQILLGLSNQRG